MPEGRNRRSFGDVWFAVFPVLIGMFYLHCTIFLGLRGVTFVSTYLPEGHPGHISSTLFAWRFAELGMVLLMWFSTAEWTGFKVRKHPSIRHKVVWCIASYFLAPIVCPVCYFTRLRPRATGNGNAKDAGLQERREGRSDP